jgi:hypothetical protein
MSGQALNVLRVFMISETIVNRPDVHIWSVVIVATNNAMIVSPVETSSTAVQKLQRTLIAPSS